jgi:hypothetical protein
MSKDIAIDVLRSEIQLLKSLGQPTEKSKRSQSSDMLLGFQQWCEAYAMVLNDSTKSHASLAFDKAHKTFFDVSQDTRSAELQYIGGAGMIMVAAMSWLYFSKPPATPWK